MNTKEILNKFKQDPTAIPHTNIDDMLKLMFAEIGATDAELRDHIIYSLFVELVLYQPLTIEQLHFVRQTALSHEGMFYKIGEVHTDSVFTRSFSILLLPLLLDRHDKANFLTEKQIQAMKKAILRYLSEEKDCRGYVPDKGWAHAVAHISDAIQSISETRWTVEEASTLLDLLKDIIQSADHVLTNQEEERIVIAILPMIVHKLIHPSRLEQWIQTLSHFESTDDPARDYVILHNTKLLLSALYFKMKKVPVLESTNVVIEIAMDRLQQRFF
ncbi:DUF2785 domain-containing protein [Paenibacillus wenxiniae]|uniref:DUF2785 domain-containing protein n=1 Tax=Paenibacillus wenxiniae TaxID=1636843 RepID=A0ABW4RGU0_9BACL